MKNLKLTVLIVAMFLVTQTQAQTNWDKVNFEKEYKMKVKIPGSASKSLAKYPTFVNDYYITQASLMKGSSHAGTLQKQGVKSVFAEAALAGVSPEALQALIDDLYQNFVSELEGIGLTITSGDELMNTKYVLGKKEKKNSLIGKNDGKPVYDKKAIDLSGSDIKEKYHFRPGGNNVFASTGGIAGNFYNNLSAKESVNMISIGYVLRFASFDGKKSGLSKNSLTTTPELSITPVFQLVNPKGSFSWITYDKPVKGDNAWSKGLAETSSRDGSFWGLSSSSDYAIQADEAKYINELRAMVMGLQKNLAKTIKENM